MAAVESPLVNSPQNMMSAFSPYTEFSLSPNSPARSPFQFISARNSSDAASLHPNPIEGGLSPIPQLASPSDVGPSPVTSTGTETTEIDDEEEVEHSKPPPPQHAGSVDSGASQSTLTSINTGLPPRLRSNSPTSVIHAPEGYGSFSNTQNLNSPPSDVPPTADRSTPTPYESEEKKTPTAIRLEMAPADKDMSRSPISPPPISTDVAPVNFGLDNSTPRAQTRQEIEALAGDKSGRRSSARSSSGSLEGIPEDQAEIEDLGEDEFDARTVQNTEEEIKALKTALHECWTLCNTLASLSSIHRERIFSSAGKGDVHEQAWKCCWKLCRELYESRDEEPNFEVRPTLDLCRDFCQALFDVRLKENEVADSVLRVSFELNNHLYNTHDRNLPEAFRERTLDFYITLCHRLMKQRSGLAEETDSLLRACWSLAEMLFSLRQNRREGKAADEELLGSAVQACWELCDLFREGWTQVRPERGTPRPSQTTFTQPLDQTSRSSYQPSKSSSLASLAQNPEARPSFPETPTTEFEDTPMSPDDNSPLIPNILILGTESNNAENRWSSAASTLSQFSQRSGQTSSTATTAQTPENIHLTRLKILILKAAMNVGYDRNPPPTSSASTSSNTTNPKSQTKLPLQTFIKSLPTGSFGSLPWHTSLLASYKKLVLSDPVFMDQAALPAPGKRGSASDIGKSCLWMMRTGQYAFLRDLFRLVFGFHLDECETRKSVSITV